MNYLRLYTTCLVLSKNQFLIDSRCCNKKESYYSIGRKLSGLLGNQTSFYFAYSNYFGQLFPRRKIPACGIPVLNIDFFSCGKNVAKVYVNRRPKLISAFVNNCEFLPTKSRENVVRKVKLKKKRQRCHHTYDLHH